MNTVPYKKILIPIDGSKNSIKAVAHGKLLAESFNAEIGLLFVMVLYQDLQAFTQMSASYIPERLYFESQEYGQKVLSDAAALLPSITVNTFLETGSPTTMIPRFAQENGYDLIIIGSRGLGLLKGLVLGSVSTYVVHHAACPVLIVK